MISASAALWNGTDIIADSAARGITPYQAAIIASLIEREAIVSDMPKVSRVIYNRLAIPMKLEFDSTVNYALDRASIATSAEDRANPSPYNTYARMGLPPTPISSPGPDAVDAALAPGRGIVAVLRQVQREGRIVLQHHHRAARGLRRAGAGERCLRLTRRRPDGPRRAGGARLAGRAFAVAGAAPGRLRRGRADRLAVRPDRVRRRPAARTGRASPGRSGPASR